MNQGNGNSFYGSGQFNAPGQWYLPNQQSMQPYYVPVFVSYQSMMIPPQSNYPNHHGITYAQNHPMVLQQQQSNGVPYNPLGYINPSDGHSLNLPQNQHIPRVLSQVPIQEISLNDQNNNITNRIQQGIQNNLIQANPNINEIKNIIPKFEDCNTQVQSNVEKSSYENNNECDQNKQDSQSQDEKENPSNERQLSWQKSKGNKKIEQKILKKIKKDCQERNQSMHINGQKYEEDVSSQDEGVDFEIFINTITEEQLQIISNIQNINLQNSFRNILKELKDFVNSSFFTYIYEYANQNIEKLNGKDLSDVPVLKIENPTQQSRKMFFQKFNKFMRSKKFNNSSIKQLVKNKLYSSVLKDFLNEKADERIQQSNSTYKDDIQKFVDFLRLCFVNIQFLPFLNKPTFQRVLVEIKKNSHQVQLKQE